MNLMWVNTPPPRFHLKIPFHSRTSHPDCIPQLSSNIPFSALYPQALLSVLLLNHVNSHLVQKEPSSTRYNHHPLFTNPILMVIIYQASEFEHPTDEKSIKGGPTPPYSATRLQNPNPNPPIIEPSKQYHQRPTFPWN